MFGAVHAGSVVGVGGSAGSAGSACVRLSRCRCRCRSPLLFADVRGVCGCCCCGGSR